MVDVRTEDLDEMSLRLYEHMFSPFGVSLEQFALLKSLAACHRLDVGDVVVKGGSPNRKVFLLIRGWAIAYKYEPGAQSDGAPICQYVGKLETKQDSRTLDGVVLPTRASVIGGSALVDARLSAENSRKLYPFQVVAGTQIDLLEWDIMLLQRFINRPKYRAVQASIYCSLYVDLIGTLDRNRAVQITQSITHSEPKAASPAEADEKSVAPPRSRQLLSLFAFIAVPFVGFGFADNFIMIVCGDYIDSTLGVKFGMTTMAAAGLGNWISDLAGLGIGDMIERAGARLGLSKGGLTAAQENLQVARLTSLAAKLIGISLGCLVGMFPLLFLSGPKTEFTREELEIYDSIFGPRGVSTTQFQYLMEKGTKKSAPAGTILVKGGERFPEIILLLRGEADGYRHSSGQDLTVRPVCRYIGRLDNEEHRPCNRLVPLRGSVIGGQALANQELIEKEYPNDIVAATPTSFIRWDLADIFMLTNQQPAIQATFFSMLYTDVVKGKTDHQMEIYKAVLAAVTADGFINSQEYALVESAQRRFGIAPDEHYEMLLALGWTRERWEQGCMESAQTRDQKFLLESVTHIEDVLTSMKATLSGESS